MVAKRLGDYASKTEPVIGYYKKLGILKDFEGHTTDEMWPNIKKLVATFLKDKY